jgi:hypothetical protein
MVKEGNSSTFEDEHMGTDVETIGEDLDDDALLEVISNMVRRDSGNLAKERDTSILEVRHMGTDREATDEDFDEDVLLEETSKLVGRDSGKLTKEREILEISKCNTWDRIDWSECVTWMTLRYWRDNLTLQEKASSTSPLRESVLVLEI